MRVDESGKIMAVQWGFVFPGVDIKKARRSWDRGMGPQRLDLESFGSVKRRLCRCTVTSAFLRIGEVKEMACRVKTGVSSGLSTVASLAFFRAAPESSSASGSRLRLVPLDGRDINAIFFSANRA